MRSVEECYRGRDVRVYRLDQQAVIDRLGALARRLIEDRPEALEVCLFGSLATGHATPGSDADILILLSAATKPFLDRIGDYAGFFAGTGLGCDIFPYTLPELARERREGNAFIEAAWRESVTLAARA